MKKREHDAYERIIAKSGITRRFPRNLDFSGIPPILFLQPYAIEYVRSYGQDSPFFLGLRERKLLGSECKACRYRWATPRGHCMFCGKETTWFKLPHCGTVHAFTVCRFGSEAFLDETPFALAYIEFEDVQGLFLSRLKEVPLDAPTLDWIGMPVEARFASRPSAPEQQPPATPSVVDVWFVPLKQ